MNKCPRCGFVYDSDKLGYSSRTECPKCGVNFTKYSISKKIKNKVKNIVPDLPVKDSNQTVLFSESKKKNLDPEISGGLSDTNSDDNAVKTCPFCAETIKAKAIKCRFCGSDLSINSPHAQTTQEQIAEITSGSSKGCVGCLIVIVGLIFIGTCMQMISGDNTAAKKDRTSYATPEIDSVPGISDDALLRSCKEACAMQFKYGSADYKSCVYCCTHDCTK